MPRKTSFCNRALLRSDARRYWPLLFLYVAVWVLILPVQLLRAEHFGPEMRTLLEASLHNTILDALYGSVVMALIFGCLTAMAVWSYLMNGRAIGAMHTLPITRTRQFFSHSAVGFGMLTAGNVLVFLLAVLASAGRGYVDWAALGAWLLLTELMELLFFSLGSLCAMATGWLLAVPVLYTAVNVVAVLLKWVVETMARLFYYGYAAASESALVLWLTPVMRLWNVLNDGEGYWVSAMYNEYERTIYCHTLPGAAYTACVIYAAAGLALLVLVWYLYQKRPSETAGDAVAFRWLRPLARWAIGLCGGWGLGLFLDYLVFGSGHGFAGLLLCQLIMGVICFFAAQMLLQKKFRIFTKRWWLETAALVLTLAAVTLCVKLDITGFQHRVPEADNVKSVSFNCAGAYFDSEDTDAAEAVIALHRAILAQYDATGERLSDQTYPDTEGHLASRYVRVDYQLRDGTSLRREWSVSIADGSDVHRLLTQLVNRTDSRESIIGIGSLAQYGGVDAVVTGYVRRYTTDEVAELTREQAQELATIAMADAADSTVSLDPLSDDIYAKGNYDVEVQLRVVIDRKQSTTVPMSVPAFALRMQAFIDGLEFQVDGSGYETEKCLDDYDEPSTNVVDEIIYD